jgi:hypothetical protein
LIQLWTCHKSKHLDYLGATNWRIWQRSSRNFKAWWNWIYLVVSSWGVYLIKCGLSLRSKKVLRRYSIT